MFLPIHYIAWVISIVVSWAVLYRVVSKEQYNPRTSVTNGLVAVLAIFGMLPGINLLFTYVLVAVYTEHFITKNGWLSRTVYKGELK